MCSQKAFFSFYAELKRTADLSLSLASETAGFLHTDGGNGLQRWVCVYLHLIGGQSVGNNAGNGNKKEITFGEKKLLHIFYVRTNSFF